MFFLIYSLLKINLYLDHNKAVLSNVVYGFHIRYQGPRSKIFFFFFGGGGGGGGLKREPDFVFVFVLFLFFLRGGGAEACYPGKIRVLVTLRYRKVDLKLTNSVLKRNVFTT